jgi:hypothetical protein
MGYASYKAFHAQYVVQNCKLHLSENDFSLFLSVLHAYSTGTRTSNDTKMSLIKLVKNTDRVLAKDLRELFSENKSIRYPAQ